MMFITVNMIADLLNVISPDFYYMLEPYRYDNYYNFADVFTTYEVVCVLFSISGGANRYRKWRDGDSNVRCVGLLYSHTLQNKERNIE